MTTFFDSDIWVTILMATYNGAPYLETQLLSIIEQSYPNWKLIIRDDGSTDETLSIIQTIAQQDERIHIITDNKGNLGSCQNFSALLEYAKDARYVMFADQDDKWLPIKIHNSLKAMVAFEEELGNGNPALVFTDFMYADEELQPLFSSKEILPLDRSLKKVLTENSIYGCTMMLNSPLISLSLQIPPAAENHDYWVALIAAFLGNKFYLSEEVLLYRQHNKNVSGTYKDQSLLRRWERVTSGWKKFKATTYRRIDMVSVFYERFKDTLSPENRLLIEKFLKLTRKGGFSAIYELNKLGINKGVFHKNILFYFSLLGHRPAGTLKEYSKLSNHI